MNQITGGTILNIQKSKGGNHPPKNKTTNKTHIKIILRYSAKKNNTKPTDEYSTL